MNRILIADDRNDVLDILDVLFTNHGYIVNCVSNLNLVNEAIQKTSPDIIVLGVSLRERRSQIQTHKIPTLVMIEFSEMSCNDIMAPELPSEYEIIEPIAIDGLLTKVGRLLRADYISSNMSAKNKTRKTLKSFLIKYLCKSLFIHL